ncbi:hypothetical protein RO575_08790 [Methylomonas sp. MO1]|uniref:hypothetical protein n=1 Tax=unclassified Methylomonas TaxID=2608980 RepID=UPI00047E46F8|nr:MULTISPECIES: hypothetical protein [unclassified Methylomonas]MDT4289654.1 hypothetical protein [Methylomonas sp. MO1]
MNPKNIIAIATILFFSATMKIEAATITPTDMTGLRSFDGGANVLLLGFDAVKLGTEDRTLVHFDISGLTGILPSSSLSIPIESLDPEPGIFKIYSFAGDGVVSTDEWNMGTLFHVFTDVYGGFLSIDTSILLQTAVDNGESYLSFSFRGGNSVRYWLSDIVGLPEPSITIVPLPGAFWLFYTCLGLVYGFQRKTS